MEGQSENNSALSLAALKDSHFPTSTEDSTEVKKETVELMNKLEYIELKGCLVVSRLSNLEKFEVWMWRQNTMKRTYNYWRAAQQLNWHGGGAEAACLRTEWSLNSLWKFGEVRIARCWGGGTWRRSDSGIRLRQIWTNQQKVQGKEKDTLMEELLDATSWSMELQQLAKKLDQKLAVCLDLELKEVRNTSLASSRLNELKLEMEEVRQEEIELQSMIEDNKEVEERIESP